MSRSKSMPLGIELGLVAIKVLEVRLVIILARAMEVRLGIELGLVAIEVLRVRLVILRDRVNLVARVEVGGVVSILGVIELVVLVVRNMVVHCPRESSEASRRSARRVSKSCMNLSLHGFGQ